MADQEIVKSADSCSIPKWGPKKGLRYEVDDFIVSPPSNEDGGFFHLRYGRRGSPRATTYERINEELSMTVEIKDGDPMISDINLSGSLDGIVTTPPLNVTPTGLSPTRSPDSTSEASSSHSTKPLFVFHLKDSNARGIEDFVNQKEEVATDALQEISPLDTTESIVVLDNTCDKSEDVLEEPVKKKSQQLLSKLSILDQVHTLSVTSPVDGIQSVTPQITPFSTPLSTPKTTPLASPILKRKVSGVVMEQNVSHSYFCTKPFQNSQQSDTSSPLSGGKELSLSATTAQMTQQLENGSKAAMAMDPGQKLGKKRRPKPSSLREMNFWAPTSM